MISIVLMFVLLCIGIIVGAVAIRDQIVQEYGDFAVALDSLSQSFSYRIEIDPDGPGGDSPTIWEAEFIDDNATLVDGGPNEAPAGITFVNPPTPDQREGVVDNPAGTIP
ncbi:hypothetical protein GCM10023155_42450 [Bremerella cremea]